MHASKKISQSELAKEAGVSREIIGRYERNEVSPSVDVAKKIADALEVSLDYLAGGSDKAAFDKQTLKLIDEIEELEPLLKINSFSWPLSGMLKRVKRTLIKQQSPAVARLRQLSYIFVTVSYKRQA